MKDTKAEVIVTTAEHVVVAVAHGERQVTTERGS